VPLQDSVETVAYNSDIVILNQVTPEQKGVIRTTAADLREAALRREVGRLTRELRRTIAIAEERRSPVDDATPIAPMPAVRAPTSERDAARLAAKDALVRALYDSRSWRMMAPLRAISRLLGRNRGPGVEEAIALTDAVANAFPATRSPRDCFDQISVRHRPDGHSRGEVLIVAPHLPLFDRQSGGLRLKSLIGLIADLGWTVTFCALLPMDWGPDFLAGPEGRAGYEGALREVGVTRFVYGVDGIRAFLIEAGGRMRYAFLSFPSVASDVTPLIRFHCPWARVIFDTVDLHFRRMQREAELRCDPVLAHEAERMQQREFACMRSADVTVAVSEEERQLLLDLVPDVVVETVPNVFRMPAGALKGPSRRSGLLFVGGFWHAPNEDAVLWFVEHVWPRIRAESPGIVFRIAGADPTPEVLALARLPDVEVLGYVPDLTPYFDAARVFVAPLRFGAGMKGKVGQSLANGLPVVTTAIGAEGMSLADGEHLLLADNARDFANCVLTLLDDDRLWGDLQVRGRAHMEGTLSEAVVARRVETLFRV
jgi:hypothetical protein